MKHLTTFTAAAFLALSPPAQATEQDWSDFEDLMKRFSEDTQAFLHDWLTELTPMLESLRDKIDDLSNYEKPEVLPNGDIIIRRKPDKPTPLPPPAEPPEGQTDL